MCKIRLLIVGAGGHGRSVAEAAEQSGKFKVVGFLDDSLSAGETSLGFPILGPVTSMTNYHAACDQAIVAIGNNVVRKNLMQQLISVGFEFAIVIHPHALVSPSAELGKGSAVMAGAIVGTEARLGVGAIVNCGAVVDHNAMVEDFGHLGVNSAMAGGALLGHSALLQAGAVLDYGASVSANTIVPPWK